MFPRLYSFLRDRIRSDDVVDFGQFRLHINPRDVGGRAYRQAGYRDELRCPLQREIVATLRPATFIDIGANYGFTALAHRALNPDSRLIAVEPSPVLLPWLKRNLAENARQGFTILPSICGNQVTGSMSFAMNPSHSQDSRVRGEAGWPTATVSTVTLASIIEAERADGPFYIKIDTQGFEEMVFAGAWPVLTGRTDWLIKTEFAPAWLCKQGTDPVRLLGQLLDAFLVSEWPKRPPYRGADLRALAKAVLTPDDAPAFVTYIEAFSRGEGWCDLLIRPRMPGSAA